MWSLRAGTLNDLPLIYELQNTTFRSEVLDSELPPVEEFLLQKEKLLVNGDEKLFLLQRGATVDGFLSFTREAEFWHVVVWGAWLKTLVYAAGVAAFDHLGFPRLVFCVREQNKRMIKLCERYEFRLIGQNSLFVTAETPPYISIVKVCYYDITTQEFRVRSEKMRQAAFPIRLDWNEAPG